MLRITLSAALVAAAGLAPLPLLSVAAHAQAASQGDAPMEAAGTAGEHKDKKAMKKTGSMKKSHMKKKTSSDEKM